LARLPAMKVIPVANNYVAMIKGIDDLHCLVCINILSVVEMATSGKLEWKFATHSSVIVGI